MNIPQPLFNESQEDFIIRAHGELMPSVAEPMERNRMVWGAWDATRGDVERHRAEQVFPEDQFEHRRDVCLWHEHEATGVGPDGQPTIKRNDVNRLRDIVRENNLRIADTDAYTALVDKHTLPPGADDKGKDKPRTVGFVGPYRLGMIGRVQPRFAIFGDEHHYREAAQTLRDRPRRSVEVLTLRANGRSYLDPIAALSEAPRLPLPVHYSATNDEGDAYVVDRYSAEPVAAFPGGGNTYIPGDPKRKTSQQFDASSADDPDLSTPENASMPLAPEDLKQIADAIMSTPQMQFVQQLMSQQGGGAADPAAAQPGVQPSTQPAAPGQAAAPAQREPYMPGSPASGMGGMVTNRFSATDSGEYEVVERHDTNELTERYAALAESQGRLMKQVAEVTSRNAVLEARAADADRRVALSELHNQYPHMVDLEAEHARCLYSAGSQMSDDQFAEHCELVEQYASRVPSITPMIPGGEMPRNQDRRSVQTEQYEAKISARSVEIYSAALAAGELKTSDQCWAEAERELGPAA